MRLKNSQNVDFIVQQVVTLLDFHFTQERAAQRKSQIQREKKGRTKDFFKKNRDLDEFWNEK